MYQEQLHFITEEVNTFFTKNNQLKDTNAILNETIAAKDKLLLNLQFDLKGKEDKFSYRISEFQKLLDEKTNNMKELIERYEKLEKEYNEVSYI
jgi:hypothetical protein